MLKADPELSPDKGSFDPMEGPLPAFCMSTYISESCYKGRLFNQETYRATTFESFLDRFAIDIVSSLDVPSYFSHDIILDRFRRQLKSSSEAYEKEIDNADPEDSKSVMKTIKKAREGGKTGLDDLIEFLQNDEFPPVLWMELRRAKLTFLDSLSFMMERIDRWFKFTPKHKSQSKQRSKLARTMLEPFIPLFREFSVCTASFSRTFLFLEVWSSNNENELFSEKKWTLKDVNRDEFDPAFEKISFELHERISALRQVYLMIAKPPAPRFLETPASWAFREFVKMAEVA